MRYGSVSEAVPRPFGVVPRGHDEGGRADDSRAVGNLLFDEGDVAAEETAGAGPDLLLERADQVVAGVDELAAEDHELGVEDVQQARDGGAEAEDRAVDDRLGEGVALT